MIIDEESCIACEACVDICPKDILYIDETDNVCKVTDESICDRLKGCEETCPTDAIKIK